MNLDDELHSQINNTYPGKMIKVGGPNTYNVYKEKFRPVVFNNLAKINGEVKDISLSVTNSEIVSDSIYMYVFNKSTKTTLGIYLNKGQVAELVKRLSLWHAERSEGELNGIKPWEDMLENECNENV